MLTKHDLTFNELLLLNSELRDTEKSTSTAYVMLIGGHFGLHRFYLRRIVSGSAQLLLFVAAILFYIGSRVTAATASTSNYTKLSLVLCVLSELVLLVWNIADLFLLPGMIRSYNEVLKQEILAAIEHYRRMEQLAGRCIEDLID
ncbi:NINE protein [Paenibacillus sp. CF384]|uniref:NINE protein n=1 Tax=Paenibacillus sp. CF384 TaxID=1884382 RepID=UPI0008942509|nr:TM2 domain-containing protein [Paenibacillus sp. CF384]SDW48722.1 TM2 domain-containing protein [Paenibacillus sp. CF384]